MKVTVIRTDGTKEEHEIQYRGSFDPLYKLAGCDTFDIVNLRDGRVMLVDDHGYECESIQDTPGTGPFKITMKPVRALKPVNVEATKLYHAVCVPGTTHQIVGDVIIANDADFGEDE